MAASNIQPVSPPANALPLNASVGRYFPRSRLTDLAAGPRFTALDRHEAFFRGTQDDDKLYDWDGYFTGYGLATAVKPGWYVPFAQRRPDRTIPLATTIVGRLTSMLFGDQNRPRICVEGDEDAENFVQALAKESQILQRAIEARNLGGACGTTAFAYAFVDGKPLVEVLNGKHCRVLAWADRARCVPAAVLMAYSFAEEEWDERAQKYVERTFWFVRYWDTVGEVRWERIPDKAARTTVWSQLPPDAVATHPHGECPVVWVQNLPCSSDPDGVSDYAGQLDNLQKLNHLASASARGTLANTDPTLVVKDDRKNNTGAVRKGQGTAIFAPGGAEYLTLPGEAMKAAQSERDSLRQDVLDACQVVIPSAEKLSGAAQSAAALRILFAPMTARCDILRDQYGELGIVRVLEGLLRLAKKLGLGALDLEPQIEKEVTEKPTVDEETGVTSTERETQVVERPHAFGQREKVTLAWPTYFPPTWADIAQATTAVQAATGGKAVLTQASAIRVMGQMFGVEDPDAELAALQQQEDHALMREVKAVQTMQGIAEEEDEEEEEGGAPGPDVPKG